jgi:hypothetical protein
MSMISTAPDLVMVKDHRHAHQRYTLDLKSGAVTPGQGAGVAYGWGQWKTLGLLRGRRRSFAAVFVHGDGLACWLEGRQHLLSVPPASASVKTTAIVRRFQFNPVPGVEYDLRYFRLERDPWPDDGDLFSLIVRVLENPATVRRFWYVWKAAAEGREITSQAFQDEVTGWLKDRGLDLGR